jgi:endoglucanase
MQQLIALMKEMTEAPGPSGHEQPVRQIMQRHMEQFGTIHKDNLGGIACRKVGQADGPNIMIAGHMDEIGFLVKRITDEGFLTFQTLGGWFDQVLLSQRVEILTRNGVLPGVISSKPPHLIPNDQRNKVVQQKDMTIDIGAFSREEAESWGVRPGDAIVPVSPFTPMHNEKMLMTKAWDNRIGCVLVLEVLRQLQETSHPNIVHGVGSVQEEVGLRGAEIITRLVNPDIGFALEACPAGDTPGISPDEASGSLTKGPVLSIYDRSMVPHNGLRNLVMDIAAEVNIPLQYRVAAGGTDAGKMHLHNIGVPSLVISVPTRYIHSHNSILHVDDVIQTATLMVAIISRLDATTVERLKD